jgi:peptide/nickel transport system substrate-binding protein
MALEVGDTHFNVIVMKKGRIYVLLAVLMISSFAATPLATANQEDGILYYGVGSLLVDLDPQYAWDSASIDVIDQVCEPLLGYNLSDPNLAIVPVLADSIGTWNDEATEYTLTLREGILFHDGNEFDANDVKWTFDRLNFLIDNGSTQIAELYAPIDEENLIEETEVVDQYTVTFHLAYPYVPFEALLCFSGSYILSNESTPAQELLNAATDVLVGTGPYKYVRQTAAFTDTVAFDDWWGTRPTDYIEEILWIYYNDNTAKQQAFLAGELDWIDGGSSEFLAQYEESETIAVGEQRQGTVILYMGMNNKDINRTMRQAISWAIDYDYVIDEINLGNAARLTSPVPEGIMYHNPDVAAPILNLTHARQILIDAGVAPAGAAAEIANDAYWTDLAANDPIATYNYSWNTGNSVREDLGVLTKSNLEKIGVFVELTGMVWADYLQRLLGDFDKLQLYMIGWGPDYNDPSNFINPLFSNTSASNGAQVNDPQLQTWMSEGLTETDPAARRDLYYTMQEYIVEDLCPWVFLYVGLGRGYWSTELNGIMRNPMGKLYFGTMNWQGSAADGSDLSAGYPYIMRDDMPTGGDDTTAGDDDTTTGIPGYSFIALVGAAAIGLGILLYKKRN